MCGPSASFEHAMLLSLVAAPVRGWDCSPEDAAQTQFMQLCPKWLLHRTKHVLHANNGTPGAALRIRRAGFLARGPTRKRLWPHHAASLITYLM